VLAASVDGPADARKMIDRERLSFPIAYGLDVNEIAATLGGYYEDDPAGAYLQPTDIIVRPDGTVSSVTYSSGAVGRLTAREALSAVAHA